MIVILLNFYGSLLFLIYFLLISFTNISFLFASLRGYPQGKQ